MASTASQGAIATAARVLLAEEQASAIEETFTKVTWDFFDEVDTGAVTAAAEVAVETSRLVLMLPRGEGAWRLENENNLATAIEVIKSDTVLSEDREIIGARLASATPDKHAPLRMGYETAIGDLSRRLFETPDAYPPESGSWYSGQA